MIEGTYKGKEGLFDESSSKFYPADEWVEGSYKDKPGVFNSKTNTFIHIEPSLKSKITSVVSDLVSGAAKGYQAKAKAEAEGDTVAGEVAASAITGIVAPFVGKSAELIERSNALKWAVQGEPQPTPGERGSAEYAKKLGEAASELISYQPKTEQAKGIVGTGMAIASLPAIGGQALEEDPNVSKQFSKGLPDVEVPKMIASLLDRDEHISGKIAKGEPINLDDVVNSLSVQLQEQGLPLRRALDRAGIGGGTIQGLAKFALEIMGYGKLAKLTDSGKLVAYKTVDAVKESVSLKGAKDMLKPDIEPAKWISPASDHAPGTVQYALDMQRNRFATEEVSGIVASELEGTRKTKVISEKKMVKTDASHKEVTPEQVMRPAVIDGKDKLYIGEDGETHIDIINRTGIFEKTRVFVDKSGRILNRQQAANKLKFDEPDTAKNLGGVSADGELHSQDLIKARKKVPQKKPEVTIAKEPAAISKPVDILKSAQSITENNKQRIIKSIDDLTAIEREDYDYYLNEGLKEGVEITEAEEDALDSIKMDIVQKQKINESKSGTVPAVIKEMTQMPKGLCFKNATKYASDIDGIVVHGTVMGSEGKRIDHAWVEKDGTVYDPTHEPPLKMDKKLYYERIEAEANRKYTSQQAIINSIKHTSGPWTKEEIGKEFVWEQHADNKEQGAIDKLKEREANKKQTEPSSQKTELSSRGEGVIPKRKPTVFTDEVAEKSRQELKKLLGGINTVSNILNPEIYSHLVKIGGNKIERGIIKFSDFAESMAKEFGDNVKPYLQKVWDELKNHEAFKEIKFKEIKPEVTELERELDDHITTIGVMLDEGSKTKSLARVENYISKHNLEEDKIIGIDDLQVAIDEYRELERSGMTPEEFRDEKQSLWDAIQEVADNLIREEIEVDIKREIPKTVKEADKPIEGAEKEPISFEEYSAKKTAEKTGVRYEDGVKITTIPTKEKPISRGTKEKESVMSEEELEDAQLSTERNTQIWKQVREKQTVKEKSNDGKNRSRVDRIEELAELEKSNANAIEKFSAKVKSEYGPKVKGAPRLESITARIDAFKKELNKKEMEAVNNIVLKGEEYTTAKEALQAEKEALQRAKNDAIIRSEQALSETEKTTMARRIANRSMGRTEVDVDRTTQSAKVKEWQATRANYALQEIDSRIEVNKKRKAQLEAETLGKAQFEKVKEWQELREHEGTFFVGSESAMRERQQANKNLKDDVQRFKKIHQLDKLIKEDTILKERLEALFPNNETRPKSSYLESKIADKNLKNDMKQLKLKAELQRIENKIKNGTASEGDLKRKKEIEYAIPEKRTFEKEEVAERLASVERDKTRKKKSKVEKENLETEKRLDEINRREEELFKIEEPTEEDFAELTRLTEEKELLQRGKLETTDGKETETLIKRTEQEIENVFGEDQEGIDHEERLADEIDAEMEKGTKESLGAAKAGGSEFQTPMGELTTIVDETFPEKEKRITTAVWDKVKDYGGKELTNFKELYNKLPDKESFKLLKERLIEGLKIVCAAVKHPKEAYWEAVEMSAPKESYFKKAFGQMDKLIQTASREGRDFSIKILKAIPDKTVREAISNYVQADGVIALLLDRYKKSLMKADTKKYAQGYLDATNLTPEQIRIANEIIEFHDKILSALMEAGVLKKGVEHYLRQAWEPKDINAMNYSMTGAFLEKNPSIAKKRIYQSYFDGEQAGRTPKTKDAAELIVLYNEAAYKAIGFKALIETVKKGIGTDGLPLTFPVKFPKENMLEHMEEILKTSDFRTINHPSLQEHKFSTNEKGITVAWETDIKVHPEIYNQLNAVLSSSAFQGKGLLPLVGRGALRLSREYKSALLSGFPTFFHQVHVGSHAAFRLVNPFIRGEFDIHSPNAQFAMESGMRLVGDSESRMFWQEGAGGAEGSLVSKIPGIGQLSKMYGEYFFSNYLPALKLNAFESAVKFNTKIYGKRLSRDRIGQISARQVEASFGELNYNWLGRSKTARDLSRLVALAPDFMEARLRFVGGMFRPEGALQMRTLMIDATTMFLGAATIHALANDGDWEGAFKHPFTVVINGREYSLRSVPADIYHAFTDPSSFISGRLNPALIRPLITAINGYDTRGKYKDTTDQIIDFAKGAAPIAAQGWFKEGDTKLWMTMMRSVGVNVYAELTPLERQLKKEYAKTISVTQSSDERKKSSLMYNYVETLRHAYKYGDDNEWNETLKNTKADVLEKIKSGELDEDAGEVIYDKLTTDRIAQTIKPMNIITIMKAWHAATSLEKDYYFPLVAKKMQNHFDNHPNDIKTLAKFHEVFKEQIKNLTPEQKQLIDDIADDQSYPQYIEKSKRRTFGTPQPMTLQEETDNPPEEKEE